MNLDRGQEKGRSGESLETTESYHATIRVNICHAEAASLEMEGFLYSIEGLYKVL